MGTQPRHHPASIAAETPSYDFDQLYFNNFQELPSLPIPNLDDTLDRYLKSLRPLLEPAMLEAHTVKVEEFRRNEGPQLQKELIEASARAGYPYSYIEKYWDDMYLQLRSPGPVHVNVGYSLRDDNDNMGQAPQSRRLAKFIISSFRWQQKLLMGRIEPDKGCLSPVGRLLGTARIPQTGRDALRFFPDASHIVLMRSNRFFRLDVMTQDGQAMLTLEELQRQIQHIIDTVHPVPVDQVGIGCLTMEDRDAWAGHRRVLEEHGNNRRMLALVDSALLIVCLDGTTHKNNNERSQQLLHGGANGENLSNRWYDKFQVISCPGGTLGINFEHSYADGIAWNRWLSETWYDMQDTANPDGWERLPRLTQVAQLPGLRTNGPSELNFVLPPGIESAMKAARERALSLVEGHTTQMLHLDSLNKAKIKAWGFSPDSFAQMLFQLAYYRLHGKMGATYESCATRKFFHGRTECIRSAHQEAKEMCVALSSDLRPVKPGYVTTTAGERYALVVRAINEQNTISKLAVNGQGVDRHLLALNKVAQGVTPLSPPLSFGDPSKSPAMFTDEAFAFSQTWMMSTSNVTTPWNVIFNFGPVADDGYGLGYLVHEDELIVNVTSWSHSKVSDAVAMSEAIQEAAHILRATVEKGEEMKGSAK